MSELSSETRVGQAVELTAEWLVMGLVSVMVLVSTLRLFGIVS
jgi:hypothetical protein